MNFEITKSKSFLGKWLHPFKTQRPKQGPEI